MFFLVCLVTACCRNDRPARQTTPASEGSARERSTQEPESAAKNEPSVIETPEIVRVLEKGAVSAVSTTHAQTIWIRLEDGRQYRGKYMHAQAGRYAADEQLFDILNLAVHIKQTRPAEEVKGWRIICE